MRGVHHGDIAPEDLIAYIDGEASPEVAAHIAACPICTARAASYARLQDALQRRLSRFDCPPAAVLAAYIIEALPPRAHAGVAAHLRACPRCTADVESLRATLREDSSAPDQPPTLL